MCIYPYQLTQNVLKMGQHVLRKMCGKSLEDFIPSKDEFPNLQNLENVNLPPVHERHLLRVVSWQKPKNIYPTILWNSFGMWEFRDYYKPGPESVYDLDKLWQSVSEPAQNGGKKFPQSKKCC